MTEILLFFVAVLASSVVVMLCERNRLERKIASLLEEIAAERSTVSRQMVELAEAKANSIRDAEQFSALQKELRDTCYALTKKLDQVKKDYGYVRNALWDECETSSMLRHSRTVIIDHCRKLKRAIGHDRFAHKIEIDCARDMVDNMKKERDHARKLMDENRERCGAEMDVLEDTIRDLGRHKNMFENRVNQLLAEKHRLSISSMDLRQSRRRIINHCRLLKRKQKKLIAFYDYVLEELTAIHTYR